MHTIRCVNHPRPPVLEQRILSGVVAGVVVAVTVALFFFFFFFFFLLFVPAR